MNYKNLHFKNGYELENFLYKNGQGFRLEDILELMKYNSLFRNKKHEKKLEIITEWWNEIEDFEKSTSDLFESYISAHILLFYLKKYIVEKEIKKMKEKLNEISILN